MAKPAGGRRTGSSFRKVTVVHTPGMADALMKEVAPLLTAEGIDLDDPDTYDLESLNEALGRAMERRNFDMMVATGPRLDYARTVLRIATEALGDGHRQLAEALVWSIEPEPTDQTKASVAQVIGVSTGLVDTWYGDPELSELLTRTVVPKWDSDGRAAASEILALARKGRAFDSIGPLHRRHSGLAILEGGVLAVAGSAIAIAKSRGQDIRDVAGELLASAD